MSHIALILDGNKRWAKKNKLSSVHGYTKGFKNIRNLVDYSLSIKLSNLTIFALSTENFHRSSLNMIYQIIYDNFSKTFDELLNEKGVKINIIGSRENLPKKVIDIFEQTENLSFNNKSLNLNIAFNYGFKDEIKKIINRIKNKNSNTNIKNNNDLNELFSLGLLPDPDLLIRTGGYQRLSNFIMYNLTYTELFFTKTLWPDFTKKEYFSIIDKYLKINRKYGL